MPIKDLSFSCNVNRGIGSLGTIDNHLVPWRKQPQVDSDPVEGKAGTWEELSH